jgi:glutamyl-tRNA(Gln) amidotransferase subunit E
VTPELVAAVAEMPVEMPEQWVARISRDMGLSPAQAEQLLNRGQDALFESLARENDPKLVGLVLLSVLPEVEKEGVPTGGIPDHVLADLLSGVGQGTYSKEALPQVLGRMLERGEDAGGAAEALGLGGVALDEVASRVDAIVREREAFVRERGRGAVGPLMGEVMKEFKGRVDGKELSRLLGESIDRLLGE